MNKWRDEVDVLCKRFGAEPLIVEGDNDHIRKMCITSPKDLAGEERAAIARCVPKDVVCVFKVAPADWKNLLNRVCAKLNVEPVIAKRDSTSDAIQTIAFNCPREMTADEKTILIDPVPQGIAMEFNMAPKQSTIGSLNTALLLMGTKLDSINYDAATRTLEVTGHGVTVNIPEQGPVNLGEILPIVPKDIWDRLSLCLKSDGAIDSCKLTCDSLNLDLDVKNAKEPEPEASPEEPEATGMNAVSMEAMEQRSGGFYRQQEQVYTRPIKSVDKKPERDICPTKDEITNLTIDLENAKSIDDVLRLMGADPTQK